MAQEKQIFILDLNGSMISKDMKKPTPSGIVSRKEYTERGFFRVQESGFKIKDIPDKIIFWIATVVYSDGKAVRNGKGYVLNDRSYNIDKGDWNNVLKDPLPRDTIVKLEFRFAVKNLELAPSLGKKLELVDWGYVRVYDDK